MESEPSTSPDKAEIARYFASPAFRKSTDDVDAFAQSRATEPLDGSLYRVWSLELESDDGLSIGIAFWGLAAACLLVGIVVPYGVWMVGGAGGTSFFAWLVLLQGFFALLIASLTLISVTAALWHVSLWKRFGVCVGVIVPGIALLMAGLRQIWFLESDFIFPGAIMQVITICTIAGASALPFQLWGGISLSHARKAPQPLTPMGVRTIMEMTFVACPLFWIASRVSDPDIWTDLMLLSIAVVALTLGIMALLVTQLDGRPRRTHRVRRLIGNAILFTLSSVTFSLVGLFAFAKYESTIASRGAADETITVSISVMVGVIVCALTIWAGTWWLRACGWQCVRGETFDHSPGSGHHG